MFMEQSQMSSFQFLSTLPLQLTRKEQTNINYASANLRYNATFYNHIFLLWLEHDLTMYSSVVPSLLLLVPRKSNFVLPAPSSVHSQTVTQSTGLSLFGPTHFTHRPISPQAHLVYFSFMYFWRSF